MMDTYRMKLLELEDESDLKANLRTNSIYFLFCFFNWRK